MANSHFPTHNEGQSHVNLGAQVLNPDPRTILTQWKSLNSLDPRSIDHQQIASLVDSKENRGIALKFSGKDATTVINIIDKVLKENPVQGETRSHAVNLLRKLAGASRQVPKSYLIGKLTRYWVKDEIIANGGFADIREGRLKGKVVAVKTIRMSRQTKVDVVHKAFCKECVLWMSISHPNILRLIAVEIKLRPSPGKFSMIAEMMTNGNILDYIHTNKANRLRLLEDVTKGLEHLHKSEIIHGDLKGPNILINNETPPRACISDFGFCAIAPGMSSDPTTSANAGGTIYYMAPELFLEGAKHSKEADMYAFGIVVYEVVTGARPFTQRRMVEFPLLTTGGSRPNRPEDPVTIGFGQGTWEFAEKCWDGNLERRPTATDALEHFERVAKTSKVVDPGPVIPGYDPADVTPPRPDSSSRNFSPLFLLPPPISSGRLQQASLTARVLAGNQGALGPVIRANREPEAGLLGRIRRGLVSLRPRLHLAASPQDGA